MVARLILFAAILQNPSGITILDDGDSLTGICGLQATTPRLYATILPYAYELRI